LNKFVAAVYDRRNTNRNKAPTVIDRRYNRIKSFKTCPFAVSKPNRRRVFVVIGGGVAVR
jgi:hypothetical protein